MASNESRTFATRIGRVLHAIERAVMSLSVAFLVALLVLINVEVFGRYLFNYSTLIADEYGGYLYAWIALLGGVHLLRSDRYLTMTAITNQLSPRSANAVALFGALIGLAICVICLESSINLIRLSYLFGARSAQASATPLFYPQMAMPLGYGLLGLAYVEEIVRRLLGLKPRRAEDDEGTYGVGEIG